MALDDILMHHGEHREDYFQAVTPPVIQSSNFAFPTIEAFREAMSRPTEAIIYSRGNNPTVNILRQKMAALEGSEDALIFSTGTAAMAAAILSQVKAGDHIVCVQKPYAWTQHLLQHYLPRFGVETTFADGREVALLEAAIRRNTRVLYLESPNSLTFELQDIPACAALARKHGLVSIIDNSYATPLYQPAHQMGVDLVVYSGTKYLNGHSDAMVGVICGSRAHIAHIFQEEYMTLGGVISPHDAALVIRGLRTLPLRLQRSDASALLLAQRLEQHPAVEQVIHPFLPSFPQYELARRQMQGAGGLFSVQLRAERIEQVEAFAARLQRFLMAVSWGGYESLCLPSAVFHRIPGKPDSPLPFTLVRFYIGLEDPDWLWEDLQQALKVLE
jgi:cystathionine beta-lyase